MSDIGDMIERGSEGPEWVERASNAALRQRIAELEQKLAAAEVAVHEAEGHTVEILDWENPLPRVRELLTAETVI